MEVCVQSASRFDRVTPEPNHKLHMYLMYSICTNQWACKCL